MKLKATRKTTLLTLVFGIAMVIMLAFILSSFYYRIDLTKDKRYTLSKISKVTLQNLKDIVYVKVYLEGDLNIPFRRMQQSIRETFDEFKVYAGDNFEYEFTNPFSDKNPDVINDVIEELYNKGLKPSNIIARDQEGGSSEKLVFPGALINYRGVEVPVNMLKNNPNLGAEENINNSIQALEFEFMRIISSLAADTTERVAFIEGHGELNEYQTGDITRELGWYFQVDRGRINGRLGILDQYKAVIIARPVKPFNEKDKFVLDQYIMQGGKVLWFIDPVNASLDSISEGGMMVALVNEINLDDLLFRYGVRINPVLIQDIQCNMIPVNVAPAGSTPDFRPVPWLYSPLLSPAYSSPVTRNLNLIRAEFASNIDTLAARNEIRKTVLLKSSDFSRSVQAPVMISLDEIRHTPAREQFNKPDQPVAVLLEGQFESAFKNRMTLGLFPDTLVHIIEKSQPNAMLVVADGDIIRNDIRPTPQGILISPLGFDRYTQQTFDNKEFIINALQYLTGHKDLIQLRSRELSLRLLDKASIKNNRLSWVLFNTLCPPVLVLLAGVIYSWLRKKRYSTA
jgi:ABC-2 type transport system permease protein